MYVRDQYQIMQLAHVPSYESPNPMEHLVEPQLQTERLQQDFIDGHDHHQRHQQCALPRRRQPPGWRRDAAAAFTPLSEPHLEHLSNAGRALHARKRAHRRLDRKPF